MIGVLLLAHGSPDTLEEIPRYLTLVRGGRPPSAELVEEVRHAYAAIGGRSPLTDITKAQADALRVALHNGSRAYVGMRNWRPFVADALAQAAADGVSELLALPMAPQYSRLSVAKYRDAVQSALPEGLSVRFLSSWHLHPGLLDAFAERVRAALAKGARDAVVFTAHSLPARVVAEGDPYPEQVMATARGVAERVGLAEWSFAYQSAGRTPEPWLGPNLQEAIQGLAARGQRRVLLAPIGFVCDHSEILYDIDVKAAAFARELGIDLDRTESLNTLPTFIRALAAIVRAHVG